MPRIKEKRKNLLERFARQQIQESVTRIISRDGVQGLTMDKIADQAGLAKGTLYRYFPAKKDLLRDTVDHCICCMLDELYVILDSGLPPEERLGKMLLRHLGFFDDHRDFFRILLYERNMSHSTAARHGSGRYQAFLKKVAGVIEEGIRSGAFRPVSPLKAASMMIEANIALIGQRMLSAHPEPVEQEAGDLFDLLLSGISSGNKRAAGSR